MGRALGLEVVEEEKEEEEEEEQSALIGQGCRCSVWLPTLVAQACSPLRKASLSSTPRKAKPFPALHCTSADHRIRGYFRDEPAPYWRARVRIQMFSFNQLLLASDDCRAII